MNYEQASKYLSKCAHLGSRPGLDSICELLTRLSKPQDALFFVHVAGTNGKGSVASFIASVLKEAGYKTGFFASPAVYDITETICINGQPISREAFAQVIEVVKEAAEAMAEEGLLHPTEFEIVTAAAYLYFAQNGCDIAVVEAGMGGRLDATNVISKKAAAVLTKIDYDHTAFLGNTLEAITKEKCGILKRGVPLTVYPGQEQACLDEIKKQAGYYQSVVRTPDEASLFVHEEGLKGSVFSYKQYQNLQISLCGKHQIKNAITAIEALESLRASGFRFSDEQLAAGLFKTEWKGRFEVLSSEPPVILDGAHNSGGADAFAKAMRAAAPNTDFIGVVGMLADKDYRYCLEVFGRLCCRLIVTEVPNPRTAKATHLAEVATSLGFDVALVENPHDAVCEAFSQRQAGQGVFCVGSLYALAMFKETCLKAIKQR